MRDKEFVKKRLHALVNVLTLHRLMRCYVRGASLHEHEESAAQSMVANHTPSRHEHERVVERSARLHVVGTREDYSFMLGHCGIQLPRQAEALEGQKQWSEFRHSHRVPACFADVGAVLCSIGKLYRLGLHCSYPGLGGR